MKHLITILALLFCLGTANAQVTGEAFVLQPPTTGAKGTFELMPTWPGTGVVWIKIHAEGGQGFNMTYGSLDSIAIYPEEKVVYLRFGEISVLLFILEGDTTLFDGFVPHYIRRSPFLANPHPFFHAFRSVEDGTINFWIWCQ